MRNFQLKGILYPSCTHYFHFLPSFSLAQENTQTFRGRVLDAYTELPLPGATVIITDSDPISREQLLMSMELSAWRILLWVVWILK
jgi:hypothetical protein